MARNWNAKANELSAEAIADGEPTRWFDVLYAAGAAGEISMPWDRAEPQPLLREWAEHTGLDGTGRTAVVVGAGLGADAEHLARLGFETTAFDLSPTAVQVAADRHAGSPVTYVVADLLDLPAEWDRAFDLVVEIFTLQAVPEPPRSGLLRGVQSLVAEGGTLFVVQFRADGTVSEEEGPPYPQPRSLFECLATDGLTLTSLEEIDGPKWRAVLER